MFQVVFYFPLRAPTGVQCTSSGQDKNVYVEGVCVRVCVFMVEEQQAAGRRS